MHPSTTTRGQKRPEVLTKLPVLLPYWARGPVMRSTHGGVLCRVTNRSRQVEFPVVIVTPTASAAKAGTT